MPEWWFMRADEARVRALAEAKVRLGADFMRKLKEFTSSYCTVDTKSDPAITCSCYVFTQQFRYVGTINGNEWWLPDGKVARIGEFDDVMAELREGIASIAEGKEKIGY
jgi:hypothetical protein